MKHWRLSFGVILCCGLAVAFLMVGCGDDGDGGGETWVIPAELEGQWSATDSTCTDCVTGDPISGCELVPMEPSVICAGDPWIHECDGPNVVQGGDGWAHGRCEESPGGGCTVIEESDMDFDSTHVHMVSTITYSPECDRLQSCYRIEVSGIKTGPPPQGECQ